MAESMGSSYTKLHEMESLIMCVHSDFVYQLWTMLVVMN